MKAFDDALLDLLILLLPGKKYCITKKGGKVDKQTEIEIFSKLDLMLNDNEKGLARVKAGIK